MSSRDNFRSFGAGVMTAIALIVVLAAFTALLTWALTSFGVYYA